MYYYGYSGGYSYNNNPCCGGNQGGYIYPVNQGYGYGSGYGASIILVLFILLVIVIGAGFFNRVN